MAYRSLSRRRSGPVAQDAAGVAEGPVDGAAVQAEQPPGIVQVPAQDGDGEEHGRAETVEMAGPHGADEGERDTLGRCPLVARFDGPRRGLGQQRHGPFHDPAVRVVLGPEVPLNASHDDPGRSVVTITGVPVDRFPGRGDRVTVDLFPAAPYPVIAPGPPPPSCGPANPGQDSPENSKRGELVYSGGEKKIAEQQTRPFLVTHAPDDGHHRGR